MPSSETEKNTLTEGSMPSIVDMPMLATEVSIGFSKP